MLSQTKEKGSILIEVVSTAVVVWVSSPKIVGEPTKTLCV